MKWIRISSFDKYFLSAHCMGTILGAAETLAKPQS